MYLNIQTKEDSAEKLAAVEGRPTKNFLFAPEFNTVVNSINTLRHLITLNAGNIDILLSTAPKVELGTITGSFLAALNSMPEVVLPSPVFVTFTVGEVFFVKAFVGDAGTYGSSSGLTLAASNFLPVYQSDEQQGSEEDNKPVKKVATLFDLGVETFEEVTAEIVTNYLNVYAYLIKADEIFYLEVIEGTANPLNRFHYEPGMYPTLSAFQNRIGFTLTNGRIEGDSILFDNENYTVPLDAFNPSGLDSSLSLKYVKSLGNILNSNSFVTQSLKSAIFPNVITVGDGAFQGNPLEKIYLPVVTALGANEFYDAMFLNIQGLDIYLTIPAAMMTVNAGEPHASIQYLIDNNNVTVTTV